MLFHHPAAHDNLTQQIVFGVERPAPVSYMPPPASIGTIDNLALGFFSLKMRTRELVGHSPWIFKVRGCTRGWGSCDLSFAWNGTPQSYCLFTCRNGCRHPTPKLLYTGTSWKNTHQSLRFACLVVAKNIIPNGGEKWWWIPCQNPWRIHLKQTRGVSLKRKGYQKSQIPSTWCI